MPVLFTNNAASTLAAGITNSQTTISVPTAQAGRFPSIAAGSGDFFFVTIQEGTTVEIVRVTAFNVGTGVMTVTRAQDGTTASAFTTAATVELRVTAGLLSNLKTADIQTFTTTGTSTWTKPTGAKLVEVVIASGGGGGASGRRRAVGSQSTAACGGNGGHGGSWVEAKIPADALAATATVVVGAGGLGGASVTVDNTDGNLGQQGNLSRFADLYAMGGGPAYGGTTSVFTSPASSGIVDLVAIRPDAQPFTAISSYLTGNGGIGYDQTAGGFSTTIGNGCKNSVGGGGGGGGGGYQANSSAAGNGATGGRGGSRYYFDSGILGQGAAGGISGANGSAGASTHATFPTNGGSGGGGGGAPAFTLGSASAPGGAGGNGGYPGGGGGGGGAAQGANSGAGGNGANGYVRVITYF